MTTYLFEVVVSLRFPELIKGGHVRRLSEIYSGAIPLSSFVTVAKTLVVQ
jgi:hypothetical protein